MNIYKHLLLQGHNYSICEQLTAYQDTCMFQVYSNGQEDVGLISFVEHVECLIAGVIQRNYYKERKKSGAEMAPQSSHFHVCRMAPFQEKNDSTLKRIIPPVPDYGSIWVVLWLFCFMSAPSIYHKRQVSFYGATSGSPQSLDYTPKSVIFHEMVDQK